MRLLYFATDKIAFICVCLYAGTLTGFTNIGDVNSHLAAFEEAVEHPQINWLTQCLSYGAWPVYLPAIPVCSASVF